MLYSSSAYDNLKGQCWQRAIENKKKVDRAKHFWENDKLQLIKQQYSDSKSFVSSDNACQFFAMRCIVLLSPQSAWLALIFFLDWNSSPYTVLRVCSLGWFSSGSMVQDPLDHGASKEQRNPLWAKIPQFLECTRIEATLDH